MALRRERAFPAEGGLLGCEKPEHLPVQQGCVHLHVSVGNGEHTPWDKDCPSSGPGVSPTGLLGSLPNPGGQPHTWPSLVPSPA